MASKIRDILERVARGETDSERAAQEIAAGRSGSTPQEGVAPATNGDQRFLKVEVRRISDDQPKVYVRVPVRMLGLGVKMGSHFAPELKGMNLNEMMRELQSLEGGRIVEVHDLEEDEHVLVSVE